MDTSVSDDKWGASGSDDKWGASGTIILFILATSITDILFKQSLIHTAV